MLWKDRAAGRVWYLRVAGWAGWGGGRVWYLGVGGGGGWERLFCNHLAPVVGAGRQEFQRNFSWLEQNGRGP